MTRGRNATTPAAPHSPGMPQKPGGLPPHADAFWELVTTNLPRGILCETDAIMLHLGAMSYEMWCVVMTSKDLDLYKKVSLARMASKDIHEVCKHFGLSPAVRKRLQFETTAEDISDPISELVQ